MCLTSLNSVGISKRPSCTNHTMDQPPEGPQKTSGISDKKNSKYQNCKKRCKTCCYNVLCTIPIINFSVTCFPSLLGSSCSIRQVRNFKYGQRFCKFFDLKKNLRCWWTQPPKCLVLSLDILLSVIFKKKICICKINVKSIEIIPRFKLRPLGMRSGNRWAWLVYNTNKNLNYVNFAKNVNK